MSWTAQYSELVSPSNGCCGTGDWARRATGATKRLAESNRRHVNKRDILIVILGGSSKRYPAVVKL
jgi:hypothetical protein